MTLAFVLLPFIIPTVLSTFAWKWMFDPTFSVINWTLFHLGIIHARIDWLCDPILALVSVIIVNIWRGVRFYAISLLAGLQTISPVAGGGRRDRRSAGLAELPLHYLAAVATGHHGYCAVLGDPDLRRFPARLCPNRRRTGKRHAAPRHLRLSGVGTGLLGEGAAISLAMFPVLLVVVVQLLYIRRGRRYRGCALAALDLFQSPARAVRCRGSRSIG